MANQLNSPMTLETVDGCCRELYSNGVNVIENVYKALKPALDELEHANAQHSKHQTDMQSLVAKELSKFSDLKTQMADCISQMKTHEQQHNNDMKTHISQLTKCVRQMADHDVQLKTDLIELMSTSLLRVQQNCMEECIQKCVQASNTEFTNHMSQLKDVITQLVTSVRQDSYSQSGDSDAQPDNSDAQPDNSDAQPDNSDSQSDDSDSQSDDDIQEPPYKKQRRNANTNSPSIDLPQKIKRRPGRPPKAKPVPQDTTSKRRPGRPPKAKPVPQDTTSKRRPGRPPKATSGPSRPWKDVNLQPRESPKRRSGRFKGSKTKQGL